MVQSRTYFVFFNTILGELFIHNLLTKGYDWVNNELYNLPASAQIFYRRFILHHNFPSVEVNLNTIVQRMNFKDTNTTNLIHTIEENSLGRSLVNPGNHVYVMENGLAIMERTGSMKSLRKDVERLLSSGKYLIRGDREGWIDLGEAGGTWATNDIDNALSVVPKPNRILKSEIDDVFSKYVGQNFGKEMWF